MIATASGEAEYYALVKTASQALGMQVMLEDMGLESGIRLKTDATAAIKGLSKKPMLASCVENPPIATVEKL